RAQPRCRPAELVRVDAAAVVGNDKGDLAHVRLRGGDGERRARRLARRLPLAGLLDAVIDAVAHEVNERILEVLLDAAVKLDVLAADDHADFLALLARQLPDKARYRPEQRREGLHEE